MTGVFRSCSQVTRNLQPDAVFRMFSIGSPTVRLKKDYLGSEARKISKTCCHSGKKIDPGTLIFYNRFISCPSIPHPVQIFGKHFRDTGDSKNLKKTWHVYAQAMVFIAFPWFSLSELTLCSRHAYSGTEANIKFCEFRKRTKVAKLIFRCRSVPLWAIRRWRTATKSGDRARSDWYLPWPCRTQFISNPDNGD